MSLEYHWTCDGCGRPEIRRSWGPPPGWSIVRDRGISHQCSTCRPPVAEPSLARRLFQWCQWNPQLAVMTSMVACLLAAVTVGSTLCATRFRGLAERIAVERARADRTLPESRPIPPRP
jgi:hypothetical protein